MKPLSYASLKTYLPFLKEALVGHHLSLPSLFAPESLSFRVSGKGSPYLLLSYCNDFPFVALKDEGIDLPTLSNPFFESLKRELPNPYVKDISLLGEDRILAFHLIALDRVFKEKERTLVFELFPKRALLALLDEEGKFLALSTMRSLSSPRPLLKGLRYEIPEKGDFIAKEEASFLLSLYNEEIEKRLQILLEKRKKERFGILLGTFEREKKRAYRKILALEKDISEAKKHLNDGENGDAIYMNFDSLKGEMPSSFEYEGRTIPLDLSFSLAENAERYYKRAKKAKETIHRGEENLLRAKKEEEDAIANLYALSHADEAALEGLLGRKGKVDKKELSFGDASLPYEVNYNGTRILFGKNARQNDTLTFLLGTAKNHLWFHILGDSGSHLIIKSDTPDEEMIRIASEMALALSGYDSGDVLMAYRRDIRKGKAKGEAVLLKSETLRVKEVSLETKELLKTAKKVRD